MSRTGVSYEEVAKAANQLLHQGSHPSVQRVRDITGTGSNTTLSRHLEAWRETFVDDKKTILPESVPEDLMSPLDVFWTTALARAEANYQQFKADLEANLKGSLVEQEELSNKLKAQQTEFAELEQSFLDLKNNYKVLETESQKLIGENDAYNNTIDSIRSDFQTARSDYSAEINKYEDRINNQQLEFSRQQKIDQERFESTEKRMLNEIDSLRQVVAKFQNIEKSLSEEIKNQKLNAQSEIFALQKQNLVTESQRAKAESDTQLFKEQAESGKFDLRATQSQHTTALSTIDKLQEELVLVRNNELKLSNHLNHCQSDVEKLKQQVLSKKK